MDWFALHATHVLLKRLPWFDWCITLPLLPQDSCSQRRDSTQHSEAEVPGHEDSGRLCWIFFGFGIEWTRSQVDGFPTLYWSICNAQVIDHICKHIQAISSACVRSTLWHACRWICGWTAWEKNLFNRRQGMLWKPCPWTSWILSPRIHWCHHLPPKSIPWDAGQSTNVHLDTHVLP